MVAIVVFLIALILSIYLNPLSLLFYAIEGILWIFYKVVLVEKLKEMRTTAENIEDVKKKNKETTNSTQIETTEKKKATHNKSDCVNALRNIINFYFRHFDNTTNRPKENIEKERRRDIINDVETLYTFRDTLLKLKINISGTWNPNSHSQSRNHVIYISVNNYLIRITQHEYGETMRIRITLNNNIVLNHEEINDLLKIINDNNELHI